MTGADLVGGSLTYIDLSLFQLVAGLRYAFPRTMTRIEPSVPRLVALHDAVRAGHASPPIWPRRAAWRSTRRVCSGVIRSSTSRALTLV